MLFCDRCAAKARQSMDKVKPFRPLGWIASTKMSGSLLFYLTVIRVLGERYKTNAGYLAAMAQAHGSASITHEDQEVARLVEVLLLPLGGFLQMGGLLLKPIFPVAQFLARIPSIPDEAVRSSGVERRDSQTNSLSLPNQNFIDRRSLHQRAASTQPSSSTSPSTMDELHVILADDDRDLFADIEHGTTGEQDDKRSL